MNAQVRRWHTLIPVVNAADCQSDAASLQTMLTVNPLMFHPVNYYGFLE